MPGLGLPGWVVSQRVALGEGWRRDRAQGTQLSMWCCVSVLAGNTVLGKLSWPRVPRAGRTCLSSVLGSPPQFSNTVFLVQAESITFTVVQPPRHGLIERTSSGQRYHRAATFTMDDIYQNRVSYSHDGSNSLQDRFTFTVSDGTNPLFIVEDGGKEVRGAEGMRGRPSPASTGLPNLFPLGSHQPYGCFQRTECNFRTL